MVHIPHGCILHSKSFPKTLHTPKSEFKRRSYVINKLEKKTSPLVDFVATKPVTKLSCDKTRFFRNRVSKKLCLYKTRFCRNKASDKAFLRQNQILSRQSLRQNAGPFFLSLENCCFGLFSSPFHHRIINTCFLGF